MSSVEVERSDAPSRRDRTLLLAFKAGARLAALAPEPVRRAAAVVGAEVGLRRLHGRRSMVERHLRRVLGPGVDDATVARMVRASFRSSARYWVDSLRLPSLSRAEVDAGFSEEGYEHVTAALAKGKGAILALPHLGGWEWAGRWLTERGVGPTVVVEALEPPEVFAWFAAFREALGMTVVPLGPEAGAVVLRALKANRIVCLLSDRDVQGGGIEVELFGECTTLPAGPATLALRTGAALLPVAVYFDGPRSQHAVVRPALSAERSGRLRDDVASLTQALADELEGLIRAAPEQWHLYQPNWPSDPGYRR